MVWKTRMPTDERLLIEAAQHGDTVAFGVLVERYMPRALAFARQMTGNREDAEDLVQDAFVKAYRKIGSFRGGSEFYTWFYRLLANGCLDHLRRRSLMTRIFRFKAADPESGDESDGMDQAPDTRPDSTPLAGYEAREARAAITKALSRLPDRQRAVFLLRHNEDMKTSEVAAVLGISEGAVKSHLARAVAGLRKSLKAYDIHV